MNPIINDKYQVISELGRGGMGVVYEAVHLGLGQHVAVKFLNAAAGSDEVMIARFVREARAGANIESEHVAKVYDLGLTPDNAPYMVMELLEGDDLANILGQRENLRVGDAVRFTIQAACAIAAAHSIGVIHRDLKPENVFLLARRGAPPIVKVLDFGLAKIRDQVDAALTEAEIVFGTPKYMAPEQLKSAEATGPEADVWALGAILYQMLAGRRPFDGSSMSLVIAEILTKDPKPIRSFRPEVSEGLEAVVASCLNRDARLRPSAIELAEMLLPFAQCSEDLVRRTKATIAGASPEVVKISRKDIVGQRRSRLRMTRMVTALLGLGLFSAGLGLSFWLAKRPRPILPPPAAMTVGIRGNVSTP